MDYSKLTTDQLMELKNSKGDLSKLSTPTLQALRDNHPDAKPVESSVSLASRAANAGLGAIQGATLGLGDEIGGAVNAGIDQIASGGQSDFGKDYAKYRDVSRGMNDAAQKQSVGEYGAGQLAGSIAGSAGVALPESLAGAAATGAGLGAVQGFGSSSGDLANQAKDTAIGAGVGAAVPVAITGAGKALGYVAPKLQSMAQNDAIKALNGTPNDIKALSAARKATIGQSLLDNDVVGFGKSVSDSKALLNGQKSIEGGKLGQYYADADAAASTNPALAPTGRDFIEAFTPIVEKLRSDPNTIPLAKTAENHIQNIAEAFGDGPITFAQAKQFVTGLQDGAWAGNTLHPSQAKQIGKELSAQARDVLNTKLEGALGHTEVPGQNQAYSGIAQAAKIAEGGAARRETSQQFGLGDKQLAHAAADLGGHIAGPPGRALGYVAGASANKLLRTFGRGAQAAGKANLAAAAEALAGQLDRGEPLGNIIQKATAIGLPREVIESLQGGDNGTNTGNK